MDQFQTALAVGALIAAIVSNRLPRAVVWICAAAASFAVSALYEGAGLPYAAAFTLCCDAAVCYAVYSWASEEWELWLFNLFRASVLISIMHLLGLVGGHYVYVAALDVVNWLVLIVISGTAILDMAGHHGNNTRSRWVADIRGAWRALRASRQTPPFWHF